MVVAAEARAEIKAAFIIPTDVLLESWPELDQLAPLPCPYQGLRAFQQQHTSYFFGREGFTEQLVRTVQEHSLTAVVGPSGSGKSSVVFAGLLPRLRQAGNWVMVSCRPGREPFQELAASLIPFLEPQLSKTDQLIEMNKQARALRLGEVHLHQVVELILEMQAESSRLLLVCDQFEELYTLSQDAEERTRYLDELLQAVAVLSQHQEPQFSLGLTLRADFFEQASSYRPFADALQDSMRILGPMNRQELQDAIEKPAHLLGVRIEEGLSERLLEAVGEEPSNLPLLEFALTQLWSRRRYRMLTHAAYEEIGGVKQALAVHAEEAFLKLDPQEEQRVRRIFTQLVQPGQATDTRRIATESELGPENWRLLARLADERLVVTGWDEVSDEETAEIVHEALIREWERLRQWTNEDRGFRQWQERLRSAMRQWEVSGRDNGALLRGGVLVEAERWLGERGGELAEAERDYILTSTSMQEQERIANERRRRRIISGLATGLGVALILALLAGWQWLEADKQRGVADVQRQRAEEKAREADSQRQVAETQRLTALSRQLAAQAITLSSQGLLDRALLLSQEALRVSGTIEARGALLAALQYSPRLTAFLGGHDSGVFSLAFSPNGRVLASGGYDGTVILWDPQSRQQIGEPLKGHGDSWVSSLAFGPDSKVLASGGFDGRVILWDMQSHQQIGELLRGQDDWGVSSLAFSPDGRVLAAGGHDHITGVTGGEDSTVILWDLQSHQQIGEPLKGHGDPGVSSLAFSPDSKVLASGGDDGTVILWDLQSRQQLGEPLKGQVNWISSVAFSPDGRVLAAGGGGTVILWDPQSRQQIGEPLKGSGAWGMFSMAFSPDSKVLAAGGYVNPFGSEDSTVILWDLQSHQQLGEPLKGQGHGGLEGYEPDVGPSVAFSPDGRILASGGVGTVILWDVDVEPWKKRACRTANRNLTRSEWAQYLGNEPYHKTCSNVPEGR